LVEQGKGGKRKSVSVPQAAPSKKAKTDFPNAEQDTVTHGEETKSKQVITLVAYIYPTYEKHFERT
jgi:hypothetical protein